MKSTVPSSIISSDSIRSLASSQSILALVRFFSRFQLTSGFDLQFHFSHSQDSIACLGDLLYYGGVEWLNISDFLGKIKKGLELHAMCFVFKSAVVFLCKERLRQKKKLMVNAPNWIFLFPPHAKPPKTF